MKKHFATPEVSVHVIASEQIMLDISAIFANLNLNSSSAVETRDPGSVFLD